MRESETVEFKKSTAELKQAVISIVAMLNKHGRGEVYFGIDDDGTVLGQPTGRMTFKDITQAVVDNRAYIRVGESDKALSASEIEKGILSRKKILWEFGRGCSG